jgi:L-Ala-D/L-Glu epimerase
MARLRLRRLQLHLIDVPFKTAFKHAAHERRSSLNVAVGLESDEGLWGWGEGLPREYVTGEMAEAVYEAAAKLPEAVEWPAFESMDDFSANLPALSDTLLPGHPSGRCAVELALIDLAGKTFGVSAEQIIRALASEIGVPLRPEGASAVHSGVIGEGTLWNVTKSAMKMRLYGLRQIKVKVGSDLEEDIACLRRLRRVLGRGTDLRVDANGAWKFDEAVAAIGALSTFGISSVEQPLAKGDEAHLPALRKASPVPIALDESLTSLADARRAGEKGWCDLFNIRLSKCGGVVSSLRILAEARRHQIGAWLGCMVGESPLLSAAGRAFACAVEGLRHVEGAFDKHLLAEYLAEPPVAFTKGGAGAPLAGPGLGPEMQPGLLMKWTTQWDTFTLRP